MVRPHLSGKKCDKDHAMSAKLLQGETSVHSHSVRNEDWTNKSRRSFRLTLVTISFATFLGVLGIFYTLLYNDYLERTSQNSSSVNPTSGPHVFDEVDGIGGRQQCSGIPVAERYDCWPQVQGASQQKCQDKGCCWAPTSEKGAPWCYYPSDYQSYEVTSYQQTPTGYAVKLRLLRPSGWPHDITQLALDVKFDTATRLHFKIYDPSNKRYEVPIELTESHAPVLAAQTDYDVDIPSHGPFYITVTRKSTGKIVFSTKNSAPLLFADQYLQIGTQLNSRFLYGLGEHMSAFLEDTNWAKLAMWTRDHPPAKNTNLYGVHPFYLHMDTDTNAHGVFLLNSNAMEIDLQPAPALTYRTIGGVLDFYIFTGPSPESVVQQYTGLVGRPYMPPYWGLGFHLCRWGYMNITNMKTVMERMRAAKMPYDVQWNDIEYAKGRRDWTYDDVKFNGLPELVKEIHENGQRYMMIVDPGISNSQPAGTYPPYDDGVKMDVFIKTTNGSQPIVGKVWPGATVFPDFFHPNAQEYWTKQAKAFHDLIPYDGMWIDMNEPSNFVDGSFSGCPNNTLENPPFVPSVISDGSLQAKTLCVSSKQSLSSHYNLHNLYGYSEAVVTRKAIDSILGNKRSVIITRSSFAGSGKFVGHWSGDESSVWEDMYFSITDMLSFQLFGIPLMGSDICGFNGETTPQLCARWMQLGAFYPFMRNHNTIGSKDQDPAVFDKATQKIMRDALNLRYTLLPYLYTLFYRSHVDGSTVARPLFFQYPESTNNATYMEDVQFMWGSALLITPVTSENTVQGTGYLPKDRWYDWFNYSYIDSPGHFITFDLPMAHINLQVRGGSIIPLQAPSVTTTLSRKNQFIIMTALAQDSSASGELFWDDGESADSISGGKYNLMSFSASRNTLQSTVNKAGYTAEPMMLGEAYIMGVEVAPTSVLVNGEKYNLHVFVNKTVIVYNMQLDLLKPFQISWTV